MRVKATIQVNGRPLRRAYVEHIVLGVGTDMYMTDLEGRVRDNSFDEGIDSITPNADIRVICQNPIVRVNDGDNLNVGVYQDKSITDGETVNLNLASEQDDYYAILNRAELAYEVVFQPLSFFASQPDPEFPLGRKAASLRQTRDQAKRIDLIYPDHSVAALAWVEPKRLGDNFPLMHIKRRDIDSRLFGGGGAAPTLIPHELAHALHFSMLTAAQRGRAQDEYADFILSSPLSGVGPFHSFNARTTPEVAYIEAGGFFAENFMEFMRARQPGASTLVRPEEITESIQAEFVASEWARLTSRSPFLTAVSALPSLVTRIPRFLGPVGAPSPPPRFPLLRNRILLRPTVTGGDVEGAIYGAIFVDFAATVGLDFAASSYFAANAITFGEYRTFINDHHPQHAQALEAARSFWGL
jgi:hypothetical protein